ncbi:uncharacterized protein LOC141911990 isoform X2 [Tubulanus polymorphus]|uniref:uncharacterized protein LOC141911990 isoform X2 n=1 Tax=Tubulanus polymorphus TaxID=672921 RepID=UPI003DA3526B
MSSFNPYRGAVPTYDDATLEKQLPLREQKEKPKLKYSSGASAHSSHPVALFNQADIQALRAGVGMPSRNAQINIDSVQHATTSPSPRAIHSSYSSAPRATNPYSHPVNPREVVGNYSHGLLQRKDQIVASRSSGIYLSKPPQIGTFYTPHATTPHGNGATGIYTAAASTSVPGIHPNAFLRPYSSTVKSPGGVGVNRNFDDNKSEPVGENVVGTEFETEDVVGKRDETVSETGRVNNATTSTSKLSVTFAADVNVIDLDAVANEASAKSARNNRTTAGDQKPVSAAAKQMKPARVSSADVIPKPEVKTTPKTLNARPPTPPRTVISSPTPARYATAAPTSPQSRSPSKASSATPSATKTSSKPTLSETDRKREDNVSRKPAAAPRPIPPAPPSGSTAKSAAVDASKVRNPRYTPTKPYDEVKDPVAESGSSTTIATTATDSSTSLWSVNSSASSSTLLSSSASSSLSINGKPPLHGQNATSPGDGSIQKMPVTNTITGYYRKATKSEERLTPTPPPPVGDTAKTLVKMDQEIRRASLPSSASSTSKKSVSGQRPKTVVVAEQRPSADGAPSRHKKSVDEKWDEREIGADDVLMADGSEFSSNEERQPGDGEANVEFEDDDDDEAIDNLEDDVIIDGSDDEETDVCSSSSPSRTSSARVRSATRRFANLTLKENTIARERPLTPARRSASSLSRSTPTTRAEIQPALSKSLFVNVPPTINFVSEGEQVEQLPWEIRKMFKWRLSPITPNIVKNLLLRSHFRYSKKSYDWLGCWGKHMKAQGFRSIREYQKLNHFPGSFQIGRKDRLWRNLSKMQVHFGKREFGFFPTTYCLPYDMKLLKRAWEDGGSKQKWIIKPPASARGIGIKVIHKWNQIPKRRPVIVQKYLSRPFLINDHKFDLRIYVYVTNYDPLRIYVFEDGLVRFASQKYSSSMKSLNNKFMHLTNYSINKRNNEYQSNTDENACQGHKWGLKALWGYLKKQGHNVQTIWNNMNDLIIKTILCAEPAINSVIKSNVRRRYSCHELFGFDIMLDETLKPWIIEVNISPSLHSNSQLDINIKGQMIKDLFNIAGFQIPLKSDVVPQPSEKGDTSKNSIPAELCTDKRLWSTNLSPDERAKHAYYCQRHNDELTLLDTLTPDDIRMLIELLDEDSRKGGFQRVFPCIHSHKYLRFFEQPRYYNLLCDSWVRKYYRTEARGAVRLDSYCQKFIHRGNPTTDPNHQWAPPTLTPRTQSAPMTKAKMDNSSSTPRQRRRLVKTGRAIPHSNSLSSLGLPSRPPNLRDTPNS